MSRESHLGTRAHCDDSTGARKPGKGPDAYGCNGAHSEAATRQEEAVAICEPAVLAIRRSAPPRGLHAHVPGVQPRGALALQEGEPHGDDEC